MPSVELIERLEAASTAHHIATEQLTLALTEMALASVADVLDGAAVIEAFGAMNEDWNVVLRVRRVLDESGHVLFDVEQGHDRRAVEDQIDEVNIDCLDRLIALGGGGRSYLGPVELRAG